MNLTILYEDEHIVAIDKPAGVMTHRASTSDETETVADWFAAKYPKSVSVGEPQKTADGSLIERPGIVHRLDTDTSGVLVLAKTSEAHAFLKEAFQNREVKKTYLAFTYGVPKDRKGIINLPIGRSRKDFRLRSAQFKAKGLLREAITRYEVVADIGTHSVMKVMPETGRTHQIRVHLKAIHHPIVSDPLYAPNHPHSLGFKRLGLHAYLLNLPSLSGERVEIQAPIPADLQEGLKRFALPEKAW